MLMEVRKGVWIDHTKIVMVCVVAYSLVITLDGGITVDLTGDDRHAFMCLMNAATIEDKPFPEVD